MGGTVIFQAKEITDVGKGSRESGILVQVKDNSRLEHESTSYVDYDEIESLLKGLDYITKVDKSATKLTNYQADYLTRGGFRISGFNSDMGRLLAITSGTIGGATVIFDIQTASAVRAAIAGAKTTLDGVQKP